MALQRAGDDGIETHAALAPVFTQAHGLPVSELAQIVVVGRTEAGLPVAHEVKGSHAPDFGKKRDTRLSLVRPKKSPGHRTRACGEQQLPV
ncbi:hypothetical protein D9M69_708220 [compost metagenome]